MMAVKVEGAQQLHRRLQAMEKKVAKRTMRQAVSAGGRIMRKTTKTVAPQDSGALRKSLSIRVKGYYSHGVILAVIGPEAGPPRGTAEYDVHVKTGLGWEHNETRIPERYLHLIEGGHRIVVGGTLSRRLSLAGFNAKGKRRKTTRLSEEHKRTAQRKRGRYIFDTGNRSRTGAGRVVGTVPPDHFLFKGFKRSVRRALQQVIDNLEAGINRYWAAG